MGLQAHKFAAAFLCFRTALSSEVPLRGKVDRDLKVLISSESRKNAESDQRIGDSV
jgi:hypothetical protein